MPIYRSALTNDEEVSLKSIRRHLSGHGICFVAPRALDLSTIIRQGESIERFDDNFFSNITGYNRLLTSVCFYMRFVDYSHILVCQLDCLIFHDDLSEWIRKGYDFVGAPWFKGFTESATKKLWRVGNGGLSLRNVKSHIKVLKSRTIKNYIYPHHGWIHPDHSDHHAERGLYRRMIPWYRRFNPLSEWISIEEAISSYSQNEDYFWSQEAPKFNPKFKVPSAEDALSFAFENHPFWCYEKTGKKLPFGCHAWARYDRAFWESIIHKSNKTDAFL